MFLVCVGSRKQEEREEIKQKTMQTGKWDGSALLTSGVASKTPQAIQPGLLGLKVCYFNAKP